MHKPGSVRQISVGSMLCDFCIRRIEEGWSFNHAAFQYRTDSGLLIDAEAGNVVACQECRPMVEAKNIRLLSDLCLKRNPGMRADGMAVRIFHAHLVRNLSPGGPQQVYSKTPVERNLVIDHTCECGKYIAVNRMKAVKGMLRVVCPFCLREFLFTNIAPVSGW